MPKLLYIGCLGYQNAGDDACWEGTRALLEPLLPSSWEITALNGYDFRGDEEFDALVVGGGTLLSVHGNLADAAMHEAMAIEYTGDPDVDFARAMIPHHEGAIAMAEVLLANGEDPTLRQMAEEIIAAQQGEIAVLEQWLAEHGK